MNFLKKVAGKLLPDSRAPEADQPRSYFSRVFHQNEWGGTLSRSGPGSEGAFAQQKIALISGVTSDFGVSSILDFGCGDFFWMSSIAPTLSRYHGVDVVETLIAENTRRFAGPTVSFQCLDLSDPAEQNLLTVRDADLLICVDVFGHLLNREVDSLLRFILSDLTLKYLLVTNRRDAKSAEFLVREKTRLEGIDLEQHPLFVARQPQRVRQAPGLYPGDFFDLYRVT